ncbi:MAG: WW domain-containing protein [bacterium]
MDLHHKLRRNPNWHPDSCNICGQLGHQAATCCNGTVDFKAIYGGPEHFLRLPTVYPSDVYAIQRRKKVLGLDALDRDVEKWRVRRGGGDGEGQGAVETGTEMEHSRHIAGLRPTRGVSGAHAAGGQKRARRVVDEPDLPEGWAAAESNGKVYYFHKVTKQTQWKRPE